MSTLLLMLSMNLFGLTHETYLASRVDDPAAVTREDLAAYLPQGALAWVRLGGGLLPRDLETPLDRIVAEPEVVAFGAPIRRAWQDEQRALNSGLHSSIGTDLQELLPLLRNGVEVAFYGLGRSEGSGRPIPDLLLLARRSEGDRSFAEWIAPMRATLERREVARFEELAEGRLLCRLDDAMLPALFFAPLDDLLIVATRETRLDEFLGRRKEGRRRDGLAADPSWATFSRKCLRPGVVVAAWARPLAASRTLSQLLPGRWASVLEASGLTGIEALGYAAEIEASGVRERLYVTAPKARGLVGAILGKPARLGSLELAAGDTGYLCGGRADFAAMVQSLTAVMAAWSGESSEPDATWKTIEEAVGYPIRERILPRLGSEVTLTITFPGQSLIPHPTLMFSVPDPAPLLEEIERMARELRGPGRLRDVDHAGTTIYALDPITVFEPFGIKVRPSFALIEGHLVLSAWPQAVRRTLAHHQAQRPSLAARKDFLAAVERCGGRKRASWVHLMDFERAVCFLWDNLASGASAAPLELFLPGIEPPLLPMAETVTRHLGPGVLTVRPVGRGHLVETVSPISMLGFFVNVAVAGTQLLQLIEAPKFIPDSSESPNQALAQMRHLRSAIMLFKQKEGRLPRSDEWPRVLVEGSPQQKAPYVSQTFFPAFELVDPWGHPFEYVREGDASYRIISRGADGRPGGLGRNQDLILREY